MNSQQLSKLSLPDEPGVYSFIKDGTILYIGKATSLKDRVKSYFTKDLAVTRGPRITQMVDQANAITFQVADSVLEALILEAKLIKKHRPFYNIRERDDKSWWHVVITNEEIPRVIQVRGKQLMDGTYDPDDFSDVFGPFPSGLELKEALKIIRRIFPYHDKPQKGRTLRSLNGSTLEKPCFDAQVGLCPGVCAGWITIPAYKKQISKIRLFFKGKKKELIAVLEKEMRSCAKARQFEKAGELKKKIFSLQHIHDVALLKRSVSYDPYGRGDSGISGFRIEAYDIAHLSGKNTVGAMVVMENGELKKSDYRKFKLRRTLALSAHGQRRGIRDQSKHPASIIDDTANLEEVLVRRLNHPEWPLPDLIVVDGSKAQVNRVSRVLVERDLQIPIVGVVKDERHKASSFQGDPQIIHDYHREIIHINSEVHRFAITYHRKLRGQLVPPWRDEL